MATETFNSSKIRGRIVEKYGTISNFCKAINKNRTSISRKLNGKSELSRKNIALFCSALDIREDEVADYFFAQ